MRIMSSRNSIAFVIILFLFTLGSSLQLRGQNVEGALDESFRAMYNLNFNEALKTAEDAKALDKSDPEPWMAQACAILFREFDRLHILSSELFVSDDRFNARSAQSWDPESKKQFDIALNGAERLAQQRLEGNKNDLKALFALTIINGLRADDFALIEKKNLTALGYTRSANGFAERLLNLSPKYYDAYLATGMGKYIIGGKAAPVRWMLRIGGFKGDQEQGIKELTLVAEHGRYLAPFARILLAFDDLRHKNTVEARKKLVWLSERYPHNIHFTEEMSKLDHPSSGTAQ